MVKSVLILLLVAVVGCARVPNAFVAPGGPVYLEPPDQQTVEHENCHYDRLSELGPFEYYIKYIFHPGPLLEEENYAWGCAEEIRCNADPARTWVCPLE